MVNSMWIHDDLPVLGEPEPVRVRVYCDGPAPFHDRKGRTYLEVFERHDDGWHPVRVVSVKATSVTRGKRRIPNPRRTSVRYVDGDRVLEWAAAMRRPADGARVKVEFECHRCGAGPARLRWEEFAAVLDGVAERGEDVSLSTLVRHAGS